MARIVYSTGVGKVCSGCGWPVHDCKCSSKRTVYDLPDNAAFLKALAQELKRACGTGGAVSENTIELQGDLRERVREHLTQKGWVVKG